MSELLTGPMGGALAGAFGMGAAAGWSFAMKTVLAEARLQLKEVRAERDQARQDAKEAYERYLSALEGNK